MSRLTEKQLAEYRALRAGVTQPPPWTVDEDDFGRCLVLDATPAWVADCGPAPADAKFIAAAPVMVTNLLREVASLKRELAEARGESTEGVASV